MPAPKHAARYPAPQRWEHVLVGIRNGLAALALAAVLASQYTPPRGHVVWTPNHAPAPHRAGASR